MAPAGGRGQVSASELPQSTATELDLIRSRNQ